MSIPQTGGRTERSEPIEVDVADLRRELRELEQRFAAVFNDAPIGMAIVSIGGRWLMVNRAICGILGYSESELLAKAFQDVTHPHDLELDVEYVRQMLDGQRRAYQTEKRYLHSDGHIVWVLLSVSLVRDVDDEPLYLVAQIRDISAQKELEAELREAANHDPLTGLKNRRGLEEQLNRQLAYSRRYGTSGALLLLDLDDFKSVNDRLGHHAGDELLRGVAEQLARGLRSTDTFARYGGDEFALLLPDANVVEAETVAERLVALSRSLAVVFEAEEVSRTVSVGVVTFEPASRTSERDLLISADRAMYRAKAAGGDRWYRAAPGPAPSRGDDAS